MANIISLITKGPAPATSGMLLRPRDDVAVLVEVEPVLEDEHVGVDARGPCSRNSSWKPLVMHSTDSSAATPERHARDGDERDDGDGASPGGA